MTNLAVNNQVELSDNEYRMFAELIYSLSGIQLGDNKKDLVKARLQKRLRERNLDSYEQYYDYLRSDPSGAEVELMLNAISTNVTSFFREEQHFDLMTKVALPDLDRRKLASGERTLRIWSSACSTGEELCTMLMTVQEYLASSGSNLDAKGLGTDISTRALDQARAGIYDEAKVQGVPKVLLNRYFAKLPGSGCVRYRFIDQLRAKSVFARMNLMREEYPFSNMFDIIFCRNVMIYFDKPTQRSLVERLCRYLAVGGYLFIGHSESLIGSQHNLETLAPAAFRKLPSGGMTGKSAR